MAVEVNRQTNQFLHPHTEGFVCWQSSDWTSWKYFKA